MTDHGAGSKWSSEREREERERRRREAQEQERLARDAARKSHVSDNTPEQGKITIRKFEFGASEESRPIVDTPPPLESPLIPPSGNPVGTRWRDSAPPPDGGGPALPNLPGDEEVRDRKEPRGNRAIWFGVVLFLAVIALLFTPLGPFGSDGKPTSSPTPSSTLPSILSTAPTGDTGGSGLQPTLPPQDGQRIVCIDAGHGGWDTGWTRIDGEVAPPIVTEAEMNLGMAWMLKAALESEGIYVVMTRPGGAAVNIFDEDIDGDGVVRTDTDSPRPGARDELQARINICNAAGADILISVHLNGYDDPTVRGYEILYTAEREFGQQNAELATTLYRQLDSALRQTEMAGLGRGWKSDDEIDLVRSEFGAEQHFVITGPAVNTPDYHIVPSEMPGVIVESVFLSNDIDAAWIVQPANQQVVIDAYVVGILEYFANHPG